MHTGMLLTHCALALDSSKEFHNFVSNTWSIEEGLPQISALALAQDTQGYLWVGTQAGIARFDVGRELEPVRGFRRVVRDWSGYRADFDEPEIPGLDRERLRLPVELRA